MSSLVMSGIGVAIIVGFLWAIYASAKETGRVEEKLRQREANDELLRRQMHEVAKRRTVDDVADDAERGDF
jgi:hypothetical protein